MDERDGFLGIDLGGTEIKAALLAPDGRVLWSTTRPTGAAEGRDAVVERLAELLDCAPGQAGVSRVLGAGVAVPGVVDASVGRVEKVANLTTDWNGFDLGGALSERVPLPVAILNDVRGAALAEAVWGGGRPFRHFICIAVGTGIGGGLVLNGELYAGSRGAAGELGHQTVLPDGFLCGCGNRGCLETVASATAIAREARTAVEAGDRELADRAGSERPAPHQVAQAACRGSETARAIFTRAGTWLGLALGNLVCALNPEAIVVGGGVAEAGDLLLEPVRREIARRTVVFSAERGGVRVIGSPLGSRAGAMGAAAWAMQQVEVRG